MTDTPNEPLLVSAMRRHASNPRVHVRMGVPGAHSSISTTAAGFLAELDAYVEDVRAEAARTVTAEQVEAAAKALFRQVLGQGWENEPDGVQVFYRRRGARILTAAGFTVPELAEGS